MNEFPQALIKSIVQMFLANPRSHQFFLLAHIYKYFVDFRKYNKLYAQNFCNLVLQEKYGWAKLT